MQALSHPLPIPSYLSLGARLARNHLDTHTRLSTWIRGAVYVNNPRQIRLRERVKLIKTSRDTRRSGRPDGATGPPPDRNTISIRSARVCAACAKRKHTDRRTSFIKMYPFCGLRETGAGHTREATRRMSHA